MKDERISNMLAAVPDLGLRVRADFHHACGVDLPAFGINLNRRPDRWEALSQRFRAVGLDKIMRAPAVDGRALPAATIELFLGDGAAADAVPGSHLALTRPAVGCFLSHLSVWKHVAGSGLPYAMVMEDDANPTADFDAPQLGGALQSMPENGMLFPGCLVMSGLAARQPRNGLVRVYYFNGTFAYIVSAKACEYLLQNMLPMRMHVDHQLSHLLFDKRDVFPGLLMQPEIMQPDWALGSDCLVHLSDESAADREQRSRFARCRRTLEAEGLALRPDDVPVQQAA